MSLPLAVSFDFLTAWEFWLGAGILAGVYAIFTLGLQLNVGFTGITNFGQAGFMAIGAYAMGILVADHGWPFLLSLPVATGVAVLAALVIGLPSLRLRADYFAIVTIAFAEMIRFTAQNARDVTGGNQGLLGYDAGWADLSDSFQEQLGNVGLGGDDFFLLPLFIVTWLTVAALTVLLTRVQGTPWGRVLRAVREDEDAARALGKNAFSYKLQSLAIAAAIGAIAGYFLALNLGQLHPDSFEPLFTFIGYAVLVLGGLASYPAVAVGAVLLWILLEGTRFLELPLADEKIAALRFVIVGLILIALMAFRPQGFFGKREEMVLRD